jgi:hypothetical protein
MKPSSIAALKNGSSFSSMAGGDGGVEVVSSGGGRGEIELQAFAYVTRVLHTVVERRGGGFKSVNCLSYDHNNSANVGMAFFDCCSTG